MVFKSLPIEFDAYGHAHLRDEGHEAPFNLGEELRLQLAIDREQMSERFADRPGVESFNVDPVTRTTSGLSLHMMIDFDQRQVLDACVESTLLSPYELILKGRTPSDAVQLTPRIDGSASGAHAVAASMALEMAGSMAPPPLAILARNLGACGEILTGNIRHLFMLAGPDYSESAVSRTSLTIWAKAQSTSAPGTKIHRLDTIADIMRGMNPISGHLYLEALQMSRQAAEIATLIFGKHPHPSTIFPGGIGIEANREIFNQILGRINTLIDYAKKAVAVWNDLVEFFYEVEPRYRRVGELPGNLLSVGLWDDPESYDASYENCNVWGELRLATPGVIVNGELRTTRLSDINIGIEEFVDHSYYKQWEDWPLRTDSVNGPLSPWHPWNKETIPGAAMRNWNEQYTWHTAPRWDREPMETGPIARLWINAVRHVQNSAFIESFRHGLEINLPGGQHPATRIRWQIPERPNALERNRARAHHLAFTGMVAYEVILKALDCIRRGETKMSTSFQVPEQSIGAGLWESGNGAVTHHVVIRDHVIANYQVITPAEWMGSPRDSSGNPGIYEAALMNTPMLEECARLEDFTGIDIMRAIRSFDP